jgi:hypothetical protein
MEPAERERRPLIAVVGPCASGKSLLVRELRERGYNAREVLQEHSYVTAMWQRITNPDVLIYLDVSGAIAKRRRSSSASAGWWAELSQRLRHARQHADLYLHTDSLSPQDVLKRTLEFLRVEVEG